MENFQLGSSSPLCMFCDKDELSLFRADCENLAAVGTFYLYLPKACIRCEGVLAILRRGILQDYNGRYVIKAEEKLVSTLVSALAAKAANPQNRMQVELAHVLRLTYAQKDSFTHIMILKLLKPMLDALRTSIVTTNCCYVQYNHYKPIRANIIDEVIVDDHGEPPVHEGSGDGPHDQPTVEEQQDETLIAIEPVQHVHATPESAIPGDGGTLLRADGARVLTGAVDETTESVSAPNATVSTVDVMVEHKEQAVFIGPDLVKMEAFSSHPLNVASAVEQRIVAPHNEFRPSGFLRKKIIEFRKGVQRHALSASRVDCWVKEHPWLSDLKSSKWSEEKFARHVLEMQERLNLKTKSTFQIKTNEQLPIREGRRQKPRGIINDGELQQISCLILLSCLEDLLFDWFHALNIKHVAKIGPREDFEKMEDFRPGDSADRTTPPGMRKETSSMHRVINTLRAANTRFLVEGDGSAWDATICLGLMEILELPLLQTLWERITWSVDSILGLHKKVTDQNLKQRASKRNNMKTKGNWMGAGYVATVIIDNIRRSGDRGTSVLNWLVNAGVWASTVLSLKGVDAYVANRGLPSEYTVDLMYGGTSDNYRKVSYAGVFEGDDSAVACDLFGEDGVMGKVEAEWKSLGFNMKLKRIDAEERSLLTFVGMEVYCEGGKPRYVFFPTPRRNLCSSATTSDMGPGWRGTARASLEARAIAFYRCGLTSVARYFYWVGQYHPPGTWGDETRQKVQRTFEWEHPSACQREIASMLASSGDDEWALRGLCVMLGMDEERAQLEFVAPLMARGDAIDPDNPGEARHLVAALL